jgi:hypothetical protein
MKFPKMSRWVVFGGILAWIFAALFSISSTLCSEFIDFGYSAHKAPVYTALARGEISSFLTLPFVLFFVLSDVSPGPPTIFTVSDYLNLSFLVFKIFVLTPYIAIPLYWFILHQIDKALKRRRGAMTVPLADSA